MMRRQFERDMREEMRLHIEERAAELVAAGMVARKARRQAQIEFGGLDKYQEQCRERSGFEFWDSLRSDLLYAGRNLLRHRLLSLTVIATLALGLGASSGLYSLMDIVVLRGPVSDRHGAFAQVYSNYGDFGSPMFTTWRDYAAYRQSPGFRELAAWEDTGVHADADTEGNSDPSLFVTCNFFGIYGVSKATVGRLLDDDDCRQAHRVVVISDVLARRIYGSTAAALGQALRLRGHVLTVVGVTATPAAIEIDQIGAQAWIPYPLLHDLTGTPPWEDRADVPQVAVVGRLQPGASRATAQAQLRGMAAREDALRLGSAHQQVWLTNGSLAELPGAGPTARWGVLLAEFLISLIALIATANVTAVLLARAHARRQEIAVRLSLGGSKTRLARMLVTETMVLGLLAGAGAVLLAWRLPHAAAVLLADPVHPFTLHSLQPDWRVFAYLGILALLVGLAAGISPARESLRADVNEVLKGGRRSLPLAGNRRRMRHALIGVQVALSLVLVLLAVAITEARSGLMRGAQAGHGYDAAEILAPAIQFRQSPPAPLAYQAGMGHLLGAIPEVRQVAWARALPYQPESLALQMPGGTWLANFNQVSAGYFSVAGLHLLAGRDFTPTDAACRAQPCPALVSQTFARRSGQGLGAVLHGLKPPGRSAEPAELRIVGIVSDTRGLLDGEAQATVYQSWSPAEGGYRPLVRVWAAAAAAAAAAQTLLRQRFPNATVAVPTVQQLVDERLHVVSGGRLRQLQLVLLLLGTAAVAMTAIGLYGSFAFLLAQRSKEMGIRIAFGARRGDIYRLAAAAGLWPLGGGIAMGLGLYVLVSGVFQHLTSGPGGLAINFWRLSAAASGVALLLLAGLAAVWGPARRATHTDPVAVLREE